MDRDTVEFFETLFDSLKREMHQEFDDVKARLDRMEARGGRAMARVIEWTERADGGAGSQPAAAS